jgi:hypothetical protein
MLSATHKLFWLVCSVLLTIVSCVAAGQELPKRLSCKFETVQACTLKGCQRDVDFGGIDFDFMEKSATFCAARVALREVAFHLVTGKTLTI